MIMYEVIVFKKYIIRPYNREVMELDNILVVILFNDINGLDIKYTP